MAGSMVKFSIASLLCLFFIHFPDTFCLENGLARTPPMGWLAWERFKCNIDCRNDPENCISEKLFMEMADRLVEDGYRDAGYEYVNVDDCWMSKVRDSNEKLVPDPERFPHGIGYLADYMHKRGLKLGIYQDFGELTCMGYPGIIEHMEEDANTFANWKVDMVKLDGCHSTLKQMKFGFPDFGQYLNRTGRPMVYSCSWPYYMLVTHYEPDYKSVSKHCNLWRNYHDISPSWEDILGTIDFFGDNQEVLNRHIGPGHWSDPDMLMIGNPPLLPGQARAQMAVWSILPAPLLMSNDLRQIHPAFKRILLNHKAIKINQDQLGLPGKRVYKRHNIEIWTRPISPVKSFFHSYAILVLNRSKTKKKVRFFLDDLNIYTKSGFICSGVFFNKKYHVEQENILSFNVKPMDVLMLNCEIIMK